MFGSIGRKISAAAPLGLTNAVTAGPTAGLMAAGMIGGPKGGNAAGYDEERLKAIRDRIAGLQGKLDAQPGPKQISAGPAGYKAKAVNPYMAQYQERVSNQVNAGAGTANDALARRFAAMGAGNSGAFIKAQQQLMSDAEDKKLQATNEFDNNFRQQEADREFQSGEQAKQREFSAENSNVENEFKDRVYRFDSTSKLAALELQSVQAERDAQDQNFNKGMSIDAAKHQGGLFGAGGFLGLGLGV